MRRAAATCTARLMRESSPPEATFANRLRRSRRDSRSRGTRRGRHPQACGSAAASVSIADLESSAGHAELAHQAGDRGRRACAPRRGAPPRVPPQRRRSACAMPAMRSSRPPSIELRLFERRELVRSSSSFAGSAARLDAVLAREVLDRRDAPLDLLLPRRVGVEPFEVGAEFARRPRASAISDSSTSAQRWREPRVERRGRRATGSPRAPRARARRRRRPRSRSASAPCAASASRPRFASRLRSSTSASASPGAEPEGLELADLVAQELEPRAAVARHRRERVALRAALPPLAGERLRRRRESRARRRGRRRSRAAYRG